jgi:hypothetical protein
VTQLHVPPINARHGNIIIIINVTEKIARLSVTALSIPLVKLPEYEYFTEKIATENTDILSMKASSHLRERLLLEVVFPVNGSLPS